MATDPKYVEFTFDWKLRWADYDHIGKRLFGARRYFVTSLKNVSFRWFAKMYTTEDTSKIGFRICYEEGPLDKMSGVEYKVGVVKSDQSLVAYGTTGIREYQRSRHSWGWPAFEDKNSTAVRTKYGLTESDCLTYQITIKIPIDKFVYCISSPAPAPCSPWAMKLYNTINDEVNSWPPDTKVAGRDGVVFNCHKGVAALQSKALETIFRYPPAQEESDEVTLDDQQSVSHPKKRKASAMDENTTATPTADNVYKFPNLTADSLKSVLEYLYTGKVTSSNLTVSEFIEMGDAAEQYDLQPLKDFCAVELWKRVVIEEPMFAFKIARFADLHDELKYLKHRALDVIAENYGRFGTKPNGLIKLFGGTRGEELRDELVEYMSSRLHPIIKE